MKRPKMKWRMVKFCVCGKEMSEGGGRESTEIKHRNEGRKRLLTVTEHDRKLKKRFRKRKSQRVWKSLKEIQDHERARKSEHSIRSVEYYAVYKESSQAALGNYLSFQFMYPRRSDILCQLQSSPASIFLLSLISFSPRFLFFIIPLHPFFFAFSSLFHFLPPILRLPLQYSFPTILQVKSLSLFWKTVKCSRPLTHSLYELEVSGLSVSVVKVLFFLSFSLCGWVGVWKIWFEIKHFPLVYIDSVKLSRSCKFFSTLFISHSFSSSLPNWKFQWCLAISISAIYIYSLSISSPGIC